MTKRTSPPSGDVSTTMLVHDAFLQLVGKNVTSWGGGDRRKFFGFAARKLKRGGRRRPQTEEPAKAAPTVEPASESVLQDLKHALEKFERFALDDAILFRLRYFLGCTFAEVAEIWSISETTAKEAWQRARAWLQRELRDYRLDA